MQLKTAIGTYDHTRALKDGTVRSARLQLEHVEISPVHRAFRPMVNDLAFDVSEMAIVTYILAKAFGRRLAGIPVVLLRNPPHAATVVRAGSRIRGPQDLAGRAIGVRAYTQTTGVWVRGILHEQYGVDLDTLRWVTLEGAHVDGYRDPPNVTRSDSGKSLRDLLLAGEIDAAIGVQPADHPEVRPLVPDAEAAGVEWSRRTGITPINHIVVVKQDVAAAHPWVIGELFRLFETAQRTSGRAEPAFGLAANRAAIDAVARHAFAQRITPRVFTAGELFEGP